MPRSRPRFPRFLPGPLRVNRGDDGLPDSASWFHDAGMGASEIGSIFISVDALKGFVLAPPESSARPGIGPTRFTLRMVNIQQLLNIVRPYLETNHFVDHTGLTGQYDIKVMFSTGSGRNAAALGPAWSKPKRRYRAGAGCFLGLRKATWLEVPEGQSSARCNRGRSHRQNAGRELNNARPVISPLLADTRPSVGLLSVTVPVTCVRMGSVKPVMGSYRHWLWPRLPGAHPGLTAAGFRAGGNLRPLRSHGVDLFLKAPEPFSS